MNIALQLLNRARQYPSSPAVTDAARSLSFSDLADTASRMAGSLSGSCGLRPGDRVLLWMENSAEIIETLFACWIAGLCVVPVNPKLHAREVAHILADSGAQAVFVSECFLPAMEEHWAPRGRNNPVVVAGSGEYAQLTATAGCACHRALPTEPAWIFYTSGTTGFPKGATLTHRNLFFMVMAYYSDIEQVHPGDTMLHAAPLSHGSGQYMLPHLLGGGHQVVLDRFDANRVLGAMTTYERVSMFVVPTMITRLVAQARVAGSPVAPNLRTFIYGGAPMYVADLLEALDVFGPRFYQLYGQGETPMTISGLNQLEHAGARDDEHLKRLGTCGVARTGVQIRVVDVEGKDKADGEPGEIVVRSDCVMSGYWNNPEASAAAIRNGWLWTGDIGVINAAGYLALHDRSKDMLISGGSNIYPREIEEILLRHPAVVECSVIGRPHKDLGEEPIAFVVVAEGCCVEAAELDALCLAHIARFKRPRDYHFVPALPKSSYGKILKTELRKSISTENEA
jgi:acyl-CoA synthetase (AMP-forming)/AMP-acid ligase II